MEKQKKYRQMMASLVGYRDKQEKLKTELGDRETKQAALEDSALRAEVLGEPDVRGKREAAEGNSARLGVIQGEIERSKKAADILESEMKKIEVEVMDEIRGQFRPEMEKVYRAYLKTLREAAVGEAKIQEIQDAANTAASAVGIRSNINLEPTGSIRIGVSRRLDDAAQRAKLNEYDAV